VHQSYVQLRAAIEQRLGPRYANFFARPQIDDRGKRIRWVAPIPGAAVGWRELSREQQAERALDLQIMRGEFDRYRQELLASRGQSPERSGGEAFAAVLDQALKTPNDGHLHFIDDQPIATFWGFSEPGSPGFEPLGAAPRAEAAPGAPAVAAETVAADPVPPEEPRRRWLWWLWLLLPLLLLLLLLLLAWLLWPGFPRQLGLNLPFVVEAPREEVPAPDEEPPGEILPDGRVIGRDGVVLDRDGVAVPEGGVVETPPGEVEPTQPVVPEGGLAEPEQPGRGEEPTADGGETPVPDAATEQPETGTEPTPPEPPPETQPPEPPPLEPPPGPGNEPPSDGAAPDTGAAPDGGAPLAIPDAAAGGSGPADFLQGRWRSRSGLVDEATGVPLDQSYQFDQAGRGRSVVRRADGVECSAPAEARMENGQLRVKELENLRCPDGQQFEKTETACQRDAQGQTRCSGAYEGGKSFDVQIDRAAP
jgi:hypothetical protein